MNPTIKPFKTRNGRQLVVHRTLHFMILRFLPTFPQPHFLLLLNFKVRQSGTRVSCAIRMVTKNVTKDQAPRFEEKGVRKMLPAADVQ